MAASGVSMLKSQTVRHEDMAIEDDYDPTNPKFITPATAAQVEQGNKELLQQQIATLEKSLEQRQPYGNAFKHYERVLSEMRSEVIKGYNHTHARVRSESLHSFAWHPDDDVAAEKQRPPILNRCSSAFASLPTTQSLKKIQDDPEAATATSHKFAQVRTSTVMTEFAEVRPMRSGSDMRKELQHHSTEVVISAFGRRRLRVR